MGAVLRWLLEQGGIHSTLVAALVLYFGVAGGILLQGSNVLLEVTTLGLLTRAST